MQRFRIWIGALMGWLLVFYNIERFHEPLNIASFVYVYVAVVVAVIVVVPNWRRIPWYIQVVLLAGPLLLLKPWLGYGVLGDDLPLTVTELTSVGLTAWLAGGIAAAIDDFERSARRVLTLQLGDEVVSLESKQGDMYREVRRARRHQRPLAVAVLGLDSKVDTAARERLMESLQQRCAEELMLVQVASVLRDLNKGCELVALDGGRLVMVMPETDAAGIHQAVCRLAEQSESRLGCRLEAGWAAFPEDEVTLAGLLERATATMSGVRTNGEVNSNTGLEGDQRDGAQPDDGETDLAVGPSRGGVLDSLAKGTSAR